MRLHDPRLLDIVPEPWWGGPTAVMITLFPSLVVQQQVNSLSMRHIQPRGPDSFDFVWTHFGFADDSAEMTQRRLTQANLFGPAGFVSADDGEVIEWSQQAWRKARAPQPAGDGRAGHRRQRAHGDRDADPRHVRLLARVMGE
jgi:salicylate 5-hydroxylase large subunit